MEDKQDKQAPGSDHLTINFASTEHANEGSHSGRITNIIPIEKEIERREQGAGYTSPVPTRWIKITIDLTDQNKLDGTPMQVDLEIPLTGAIGSHLRNMFLQLGLLTE